MFLSLTVLFPGLSFYRDRLESFVAEKAGNLHGLAKIGNVRAKLANAPSF
jgi:hypothetical protein